MIIAITMILGNLLYQDSFAGQGEGQPQKDSAKQAAIDSKSREVQTALELLQQKQALLKNNVDQITSMNNELKNGIAGACKNLKSVDNFYLENISTKSQVAVVSANKFGAQNIASTIGQSAWFFKIGNVGTFSKIEPKQPTSFSQPAPGSFRHHQANGANQEYKRSDSFSCAGSPLLESLEVSDFENEAPLKVSAGNGRENSEEFYKLNLNANQDSVFSCTYELNSAMIDQVTQNLLNEEFSPSFINSQNMQFALRMRNIRLANDPEEEHRAVVQKRVIETNAPIASDLFTDYFIDSNNNGSKNLVIGLGNSQPMAAIGNKAAIAQLNVLIDKANRKCKSQEAELKKEITAKEEITKQLATEIKRQQSKLQKLQKELENLKKD